MPLPFGPEFRRQRAGLGNRVYGTHPSVWRPAEQCRGKLPDSVGRACGSDFHGAVREIPHDSPETEVLSFPNRPPAVSDALYPAGDSIVDTILIRLVQAGYLRMFAIGSGDQPRMQGKGHATG